MSAAYSIILCSRDLIIRFRSEISIDTVKILKSINVLLFSIKRISLRLYQLVFQRLNGFFVRLLSIPPYSLLVSIKLMSLNSLISILKMIHRKPTRIELRVEDEMQELEAALKQRQP